MGEGTTAPPAEVFVDAGAAGGRESALVGALEELGVTPRVRVLPPRRGQDGLQWLVLVALPLQAFLGGIGGKLAEDAYVRLRGAVRALTGRGGTPGPDGAPPRSVVLQDADTGLQIVLDPGLDAEAYGKLLTLDLTGFRLGPVRYDPARGRWLSDLDEASGP